MRFSYIELQKYIDSPLPSVEDLAEELSNRAFEVEEIIAEGDDFLMEVKILPDRPDCKNPEGFAREVSAIFNLSLIDDLVNIADERHCRTKINFTAKDINLILGTELSELEIIEFLRRFRIGVKKGEEMITFIPPDREDLNIIEDLADEVGRLYGLDKIQTVPLPRGNSFSSATPIFESANRLRVLLVKEGFTEIYGYTFSNEGEEEVEKPLAEDKAFLRTNLTDGLREKLILNLRNLLFENSPVKLFEIGTIFTGGKEIIRLGVAIGFNQPKFKKFGLPENIKKWGGKIYLDDTTEILEIDLEDLLKDHDLQGLADLSPFIKWDVEFKQFSLQPRIARDIAVWADKNIQSDEVAKIIKENAGSLLTEGPILFDKFEKDDKISYAFRTAFQAEDRTLTDDEVGKIMEKIQSVLKSKGLEVR